MKKGFFLFFLISLGVGLLQEERADAQSVPVDLPVFDAYYRRAQLLGKVDSDLSFSVRPLLYPAALKVHRVFDPDSTVKRDHWTETGPVAFASGHGSFQLLPFSWQQQFNSDHPYGWNDGPMIPARGYQTMISGGFYFRYGPLSIQFRPEYVYAANKAFNGFDSGHNAQDLTNYYVQFNDIDLPERFGNVPYHHLFWGQSSIRLTFGAISLGLSNENLWWGPGINNALIIDNNAPGFKHLTLNTVRPMKTFLGSFEGQLFAGRLDASGYPPLATTTLPDGTNLFLPKRNDWRYFTGLNINYHPKWIPGLTLGFIRTFNAYEQDVHGLTNYLPYFLTFFKGHTAGGQGDPFPRDQITSVYARWLFPKAQAELYFEYGLEDNSYDLADFIGSPDHSRAYIFGFRKLLPISGTKDQHILFAAEVTQTSQDIDYIVRGSANWYLSYQVTQGHTNLGQVIGAGTGPGGNIQSMEVSWVSGLKSLGVSLERFEHDGDLAEEYFPPINGNSRNWVDLALALNGAWTYKNLVFNAKLQGIKSLNYEWILKDFDPGQYYIPHNDVYNFHGELGITYRF